MPIIRGLGRQEFTVGWTESDRTERARNIMVDFDTGGFVLVDVD